MNRMKHLLSYFAFFMVYLPLAIYGQVPLNWTRDEINPGEDFTLSPDDTVFTEGLQSLHMSLNTAAVPYLISDVYYILPGAEYDFSIDVFDNDTAGQVKIYADFYDTYGFNVYGKPPVFSSDSSDWQTISWHDTVPSQAVVGYVMIKFQTQPDLYHFTRRANIWIDNARFQQNDINLVLNGGFEFWDLGTKENGDPETSLEIYPNPANDYANLKLPEDISSVSVTDFSGKEIFIKKDNLNETLCLDVKHWPSGIYFINAVSENGSGTTSKLIIR
jgi:hypothetical protein